MCKSKTSLFDFKIVNLNFRPFSLSKLFERREFQFSMVLGLLLLSSCANIITPTGGEKDISPPKILKLDPDNLSLNFSSKSFTISFDEFIQLNNIGTQLIISPPLKTPPDFVIKGKTIIVKFKDDLLPNTTYTMNFGNAIRDNNENNPLENFTYVFSTGSFIDSLSLRGNVKNALTLENEKDVLVLLYEENSDSLPFLKLPYYYAKTDGSGNFSLENLKSGKFKVVALKDQNSSFLYDDFEKEMIGFSDTMVSPYFIEKLKPAEKDTLSGSKLDSIPTSKVDSISSKKGMIKNNGKSISLLIFSEEKSKQYLKKAYCEYFGKLVFIFNKKPEKLILNPLNTSFKKEWNLLESGVAGDTVIAWLSDVELDSLKLEISDNATVIDTVLLALKKRSDTIEKQSGSGKNLAKEKKAFKLELEKPQTNSTHNQAKDFFITFNHPIKDYDFSKFLLKEENDTVKFNLDSKDPALRKFTINYHWKDEKKYELVIPKGTVTDIFDLKNDTIKISFSTQQKDYFGAVILSLKCQSGNYILQFTDEKNNPVLEKSFSGNEKLSFEGLEPKSYGLRIINDENNNGKWDTGNYLEKKQPEKIILYQQKINVRSNWDVEVDWEVK